MKSFSKRLTRRIVLALTLVLIIIIAGATIMTSRFIGTMTKAYFEHLADIENESVEKRLHDIQVAVNNSIDEVEEDMSNPDSVFIAISHKLHLNPQVILGFGAGFEPNYYPEKGRWFEPYTIWVDGHVTTKQVGSADHDYFTYEWYVEGMKHDEGYWSNGYFFEVAGKRMMICTFSKPVYDDKRRKVGVYGGDISLEMIHDYLISKDLRANTEGVITVSRDLEGDPHQWVRSIIVDRNGYYISHPDKEYMLRDNFFEAITLKTDTVADRMVSDMKAGKKGSADLMVDGVPSTVFYSPLERTGWSLVVILPNPRYYAVVIEFCLVLSSILLIGLLAVYIISCITIRRAARPLQVLANSADEVAKGNFNAPLPTIRHQDEIGMLRDSFGNMQQSLTRYIDELKTTTAQKTAIESELTIANHIQMSMVPKNIPDSPNLAIYGMLKPAKEVGGDIYDFLLRERCLYFCIGDVSGKGVPAALVMAAARGAFRMMAEEGLEPQGIVSRINNLLCRNNDLNAFITYFVGVLDLDTGHLHFCNAGHKPPYVNGEPLTVERNLPVGIFEDYVYKPQEIDLAPGTALFLYTDGLDEAGNAKRQFYGKQRIKEVLLATAPYPRTIIEQMTQAVTCYVGDTEQSDDLTMLALKWK